MFASWLIGVGIGVGLGIAFFWWNAPAMVAWAAIVERKPVPVWVRLMTAPGLYFLETRKSISPGRHSRVVSVAVALFVVIGSLGIYHYGVWVSGSIWADVNTGVGKIVIAESGFPIFLAVTWGVLTWVLAGYLRKLSPESDQVRELFRR